MRGRNGLRRFAVLGGLLLLAACGEDGPSKGDGGDGGAGGTGGGGGTGGDTGCVPACEPFFACVGSFCVPDGDGDGVAVDADRCPSTPAGETVDAQGCAFAEAPVPWNEGPYGTGIRDVAGDFTVDTLDGPWSFRAGWSGNDSYLFVVKYDASEYARAYWASDVRPLLQETPPNTHLVFLSADADPQADMEAMKARIDHGMRWVDDDRAEAWAGRIHYVVDGMDALDGALGEFVEAHPFFHFAIDRFQRWREVGMLFDYNDGSYPIRFLGAESSWFEHERRIERTTAALEATEVVVADGDRHAGGWQAGYATRFPATFPSAAEMAGFDSMAVWIYTACPGHLQGKDAGCNEWDYAHHLLLCDADDETSCTELVRYVTPYGREGEWLTDVSPLLPLLKDGGSRVFKYEGANGYDLHLKVLLWNAGKPYRPVEARFLWGRAPSAQAWNETYNPAQLPVTFTVDDPSATKVELFAAITGHGFGGTADNCAEFCDHQHEFKLNDATFLRDHPTAGTNYGCYDRVAEGVVPNQFGSWPFGRAGWCPGEDVKPWSQDVSSAVVSGENTLSYRALFNGNEYVPVVKPDVENPYLPELRVASWVVFYAPVE